MKIKLVHLLSICLLGGALLAQPAPEPLSVTDSRGLKWTADGNAYLRIESGAIVQVDAKTGQKTTLVSSEKLTPSGQNQALSIVAYEFSADKNKLLIYTNAKRVWRYATRGDYWVLNLASSKLEKLGSTMPEASLMFARFSPDGTKAAYVSKHN